jgi:phage/plasmid-associated DNA primase
MRAFGNYYGELKLEYFTTSPHSPDAPNANLYGIAHSRIINTSEVDSSKDKGTVWLDAPFKRLTGNDSLVTRKPYSPNPLTFTAGNIIIQCNTMPLFKGTDDNVLALMLRILILNLPFSFVDDDSLIASDPSKYRKRDNTVKHLFETDDKYKYALLDVLFDLFQKHKDQFLKGTFLDNAGTPPQKVRDATNSYFGQFDTTLGVNAWLADNVEEAELGPDHKPLDVGVLFKDFIRDTGAKLSKVDFVDKVKAALGERSKDRAEHATTRGIYKKINATLLQGYALKEVLKPSALDTVFEG